MGEAMGFGELKEPSPYGGEAANCLWTACRRKRRGPIVVVIVELFYSLKRILLLGGLNHASLIWLKRYSNLLRLLSSRLGETMSARRHFFCCCNPWRLYLMRRRVTYTKGASFIEHHFCMLFLVLFGLPRGSIWVSLGKPRALSGDSGAFFSCAGCVDPRRLLISYFY